jgi:hypothetical protein
MRAFLKFNCRSGLYYSPENKTPDFQPKLHPIAGNHWQVAGLCSGMAQKAATFLYGE